MSETNLQLVHGEMSPVECVVQTLEAYLAKARTGDVVGLAIVSLDRGGGFSTEFTDAEEPRLLGGVARLQHAIQRSMDRKYGWE